MKATNPETTELNPDAQLDREEALEFALTFIE